MKITSWLWFLVAIFVTAFAPLKTQAQAKSKLVMHERLIIKAADRSRFCGERAEDHQTMCLPDDVMLAHTRGVFGHAFTTDLGSCGYIAGENAWRCWGSTGSSYDALQGSFFFDTAPTDIVTNASNVCFKTSNDEIACRTRLALDHGPYKITDTRFGPFRQIKSFAFSASALCVIDSGGVKCQTADLVDQLPSTARFVNPRAIAASSTTLCVLDDAAVSCWSQGDGAKIKVHPEWSTARLIRANSAGVCAVLSSGAIECDLPNVTTGKRGGHQKLNPATPVPPNLSDVVDLAMDDVSACALLSTGSVRCWGDLEQMFPAPALTTAVDISLASSHACATIASGEFICWGENSDGELDQPLRAGVKPLRYAFGYSTDCQWNDTGALCLSHYGRQSYDLTKFNDVLSMAIPQAYDDDLCIATKTSVECFGNNSVLNNVPTADVQGTQVIAASAHDACAALATGRVVCWGETSFGNSPSTLRSATKLFVVDQAAVCAMDKFGLLCWGPEVDGADPAKPPVFKVPAALTPDGAVKDAVASGRHICALDQHHQVTCWGDDEVATEGVPTDLNNVVAIYSYGRTMCATDDDGVKCWGDVNALPRFKMERPAHSP